MYVASSHFEHLLGENFMKSTIAFLLFSLCASVLLSVPAFAQADVPRQTTAITYPLNENVVVRFRGTTRFPRMKGEAKIRRTARSGTQVDLSVSKMPRPFELGAGYATYVLWAVSPDGQIDNLGEIKRRGFFEFDSRISVTTRLQTFALLVTAEPHFLVRRPSQAIMLENLSPYAPSGRSLATTRGISFFGNSSDYFRDARTPEIAEIDYSKTPSAVLQAIQAIALAKFAGAQRDAEEELEKAEALLAEAQTAWREGKNETQVDMIARQAISIAVSAEGIAMLRSEAREQRNERNRADAEVRSAEERFTDALEQVSDLRAELTRETRARELSERDVLNLSNQLREVRGENNSLAVENARLKAEVESLKARIDSLEKERQGIDEAKRIEEARQRVSSQTPALIESLRRFGTVTVDRGNILLNLPDSYWAGPRAAVFSSGSLARIDSLAQVVASAPDFKVEIMAHSDDDGTAEDLKAFSQSRADAIALRFVNSAVSQDRILARGIGAESPVAANSTAAGKSRNRRVLVMLSPIQQ
jgi:outer membrane protein OmpA-like peptidoglycan-associated protein